MRIALALLLALCSTSAAGEEKQFWGTWEPRPALRDFWRPVDQSWWDSTRLPRYCRDYARRTTPEALIPEMIADLKRYPSEARWAVYATVASFWPRQRTLRVLQPLTASTDVAVRRIATEFVAELE